ncbi:hypothetical protein ABID29_002027 [Streptococcus rupicaprae]|uniref:Uncharacterized protein n=1 Tax=Streptococcus rupicaprae TaxID=759619 RepID=A0ABV2FJY6_9STRE
MVPVSFVARLKSLRLEDHFPKTIISLGIAPLPVAF